jgi:hypothetical protein
MKMSVSHWGEDATLREQNACMVNIKLRVNIRLMSKNKYA